MAVANAPNRFNPPIIDGWHAKYRLPADIITALSPLIIVRIATIGGG